jgi:hypothetical protein
MTLDASQANAYVCVIDNESAGEHKMHFLAGSLAVIGLIAFAFGPVAAVYAVRTVLIGVPAMIAAILASSRFCDDLLCVDKLSLHNLGSLVAGLAGVAVILTVFYSLIAFSRWAQS